jgi:hypothetical protein
VIANSTLSPGVKEVLLALHTSSTLAILLCWATADGAIATFTFQGYQRSRRPSLLEAKCFTAGDSIRLQFRPASNNSSHFSAIVKSDMKGFIVTPQRSTLTPTGLRKHRPSGRLSK